MTAQQWYLSLSEPQNWRGGWMKQEAAIVIGAALIALALIFKDRYEIVPNGVNVAVWRVDNLTGELLICVPSSRKLRCIPEGDIAGSSTE
jgi:threonine/homoserine efflux transporter RhtA